MIVGAWRWHQYEDAFAKGLEENGAQITRFSTSRFFEGRLGRVQLTLPLPGNALLRLNREVIREASAKRPDYVLFWRPTHILPNTVMKLCHLGIQTISYNNDDPFGPGHHNNAPWHHHWLWFWYLRCLPKFHRNFFFRQLNCEEALAHGASHAAIMMPYYLPWQDRPVALSQVEQVRFSTDVVFVGHYEPDGREQCIRALVNAGIKVKVWGGYYWSRDVLGDLYPKLAPIVPAEGDDYAKALCGAKVCLCFLSKLNRDTYTRRCFEIPACGRVMLAERTDDLLEMFKEGEEACFFSSTEELVAKAKWLLDNPDIREQIAQAGLRRVWADGHDVNSRARQFLEVIKQRQVNECDR
jgi:glycosyltransferase involved in cell wall biosynthesis